MNEPTSQEDTCLINGRKALTYEDVQQWFREANLHVPSTQDVGAIAARINQFDVLGFLWKDDPEFKNARKNNRSEARLREMAKAFKVIEQNLPIAIADAKRGYSGDFEAFRKPYDDLLKSVELCMAVFAQYLSKRRGRTPTGWHKRARILGGLFRDAHKAAGGVRLGFGQPSSRGIPLIKKALSRLGIDASEERIVDAMRAPRMRQNRKGGETKDDFPQTTGSM